MRYAIAFSASLLAVGLITGLTGSAQADREDRARSYDGNYLGQVERDDERRAEDARKYRYADAEKKRSRSSYRYSYPWSAWGPFAAPPGL